MFSEVRFYLVSVLFQPTCFRGHWLGTHLGSGAIESEGATLYCLGMRSEL